jgi:flagellin FlaB
MIHGRWTRFRSDQRGITGLETAIILIAFVVVASVFAYTILSAGIFSAEKGKEAIHSGLSTARSSMQLSGPVLARDTDGDNQVEQLLFTISNSLRGSPLNLTATVDADADADGVLSDEAVKSHSLVITFIDQNQYVTDIAWTSTQIGKGDSDALMETGERFELLIDLTGISPAVDENDTFVLEIKPAKGSSVTIERTIPGRVDDVMNLR